MPSTEFRGPRVSDKPTFLVAATVVIAVVVAGFAQSYYLRPLFAHGESLSLLVHVHGALMTSWMVLFLVQILLVATGRTHLHRRLGRAGAVLLTVILVTALPMTVIAARLGGDHMPGPPVPGLAFVLGFLMAFGVLAGTGLAYTRRPDIHKRLMLVASVAAMEAGTVRLPFEFLANPLAAHLTTDLLLLGIILIDAVRHRRAHPAFMFGGMFLVGVQAMVGWVAGTDAWARIAQLLIRA